LLSNIETYLNQKKSGEKEEEVEPDEISDLHTVHEESDEDVSRMIEDSEKKAREHVQAEKAACSV